MTSNKASTGQKRSSDSAKRYSNENIQSLQDTNEDASNARIEKAWKKWQRNEERPQQLSDEERAIMNHKITDGLHFYKDKLMIYIPGFAATNFPRMPVAEIKAQLDTTGTPKSWSYRTWLAQAYLYDVNPALEINDIKSRFRERLENGDDFDGWPTRIDNKDFKACIQVLDFDVNFVKMEEQDEALSHGDDNDSVESDNDQSSTYQDDIYALPADDQDTPSRPPLTRGQKLRNSPLRVVVPKNFANANTYKPAPPSAGPVAPKSNRKVAADAERRRAPKHTSAEDAPSQQDRVTGDDSEIQKPTSAVLQSPPGPQDGDGFSLHDMELAIRLSVESSSQKHVPQEEEVEHALDLSRVQILSQKARQEAKDDNMLALLTELSDSPRSPRGESAVTRGIAAGETTAPRSQGEDPLHQSKREKISRATEPKAQSSATASGNQERGPNLRPSTSNKKVSDSQQLRSKKVSSSSDAATVHLNETSYKQSSPELPYYISGVVPHDLHHGQARKWARHLTDADANTAPSNQALNVLTLYRDNEQGYCVRTPVMTFFGQYPVNVMLAAINSMWSDYYIQKGLERTGPKLPVKPNYNPHYVTPNGKKRKEYILKGKESFKAELGPKPQPATRDEVVRALQSSPIKCHSQGQKRKSVESDDELEIVSDERTSIERSAQKKRRLDVTSETAGRSHAADEDIEMADVPPRPDDISSSQAQENTASEEGTGKVDTPADVSPWDNRDVIHIESDESDKEPATNAQTLPPLTELRTDGNKRFSCEWKRCSKSHVTPKELFSHVIDSHYPTNECKWDHCGLKPCKTRDDFIRHMYSHINYRIYICDLCSAKAYGQLVSLGTHFRYKHVGFRPPKFEKGSILPISPSTANPGVVYAKRSYKSRAKPAKPPNAANSKENSLPECGRRIKQEEEDGPMSAGQLASEIAEEENAGDINTGHSCTLPEIDNTDAEASARTTVRVATDGDHRPRNCGTADEDRDEHSSDEESSDEESSDEETSDEETSDENSSDEDSSDEDYSDEDSSDEDSSDEDSARDNDSSVDDEDASVESDDVPRDKNEIDGTHNDCVSSSEKHAKSENTSVPNSSTQGNNAVLPDARVLPGRRPKLIQFFKQYLATREARVARLKNIILEKRRRYQKTLRSHRLSLKHLQDLRKAIGKMNKRLKGRPRSRKQRQQYKGRRAAIESHEYALSKRKEELADFELSIDRETAALRDASALVDALHAARNKKPFPTEFLPEADDGRPIFLHVDVLLQQAKVRSDHAKVRASKRQPQRERKTLGRLLQNARLGKVCTVSEAELLFLQSDYDNLCRVVGQQKSIDIDDVTTKACKAYEDVLEAMRKVQAEREEDPVSDQAGN